MPILYHECNWGSLSQCLDYACLLHMASCNAFRICREVNWRILVECCSNVCSCVWSVIGWQAPYGWPAALGLTPPTAGAATGTLFTDHQVASAPGAKVAAADAINNRSPELHQRFSLSLSLSLSLHFNSLFPGEPGLAGVYWSKGWWKWCSALGSYKLLLVFNYTVVLPTHFTMLCVTGTSRWHWFVVFF